MWDSLLCMCNGDPINVTFMSPIHCSLTVAGEVRLPAWASLWWSSPSTLAWLEPYSRLLLWTVRNSCCLWQLCCQWKTSSFDQVQTRLWPALSMWIMCVVWMLNDLPVFENTWWFFIGQPETQKEAEQKHKDIAFEAGSCNDFAMLLNVFKKCKARCVPFFILERFENSFHDTFKYIAKADKWTQK